jgi:hypothetical protein
LGFIPDEDFNQRQDFHDEPRYLQESSASPAIVNWRDSGAVTSVKNQGRKFVLLIVDGLAMVSNR